MMRADQWFTSWIYFGGQGQCAGDILNENMCIDLAVKRRMQSRSFIHPPQECKHSGSEASVCQSYLCSAVGK